MLNYKKLMAHKPTSFGTMTNRKGQVIEFFENPICGDDAPVICASHELELAAHSTFFETDDMEHGEDYEPSFQDGKFYIGDMLEE